MADSLYRLQEAAEDLCVIVPSRYRPVLLQRDFCISLNILWDQWLWVAGTYDPAGSQPERLH
jgi:hypothetical protein